MELPQWASFLGVVLASVLFLKAALRRRRRQYNLPPGPAVADHRQPQPHRHAPAPLHPRALQAVRPAHATPVRLFPVVVGSSVDMAKFFLKTHDVVFTDRPKTAAGRYTTYNYSDITWSPYGAYWRQARKMCLTELFSAKRLESYEYIRREEVLGLLGDLYQAAPVPAGWWCSGDYLSTVSLNVITRMVMGKKYLEKEVRDEAGAVITTPEEFKRMIDELFLLNGVLNIGDSIPWLDWMDLQGYIKRMKKLSKKFDRFLEHVVDEHSERRRREGKASWSRTWLTCCCSSPAILVLRSSSTERASRPSPGECY
ncbi:hypothetical protein ZWY2020_025797 [Hordeum vulgare]|nr:hypothetical protein ZWY2020_025797 [Hordeum vulgare]